jgi:streptomycin 6-kinase
MTNIKDERVDRDNGCYYLKRWHLTQDGDPIITNTSRLLPVIYQDSSAMLKISTSEEERAGALLMVWWNGEGAARIVTPTWKLRLVQVDWRTRQPLFQKLLV